MPRKYGMDQVERYEKIGKSPLNTPAEKKRYAEKAAASHPDNAYKKVVTLRLHKNLLERVDDLVPIFKENEKLSPNGNSDRSAVIRALIELGLQNYEGDE